MTSVQERLVALLEAQRDAGAKPDASAIADPLDAIAKADEKIRETAKWLLTSFAAIGGVLVGGLGLSSLGKLTGDTPDERVAAAVVGLVLGISGVGLAIWFTGRVLSPFLNTFASIDKHPKIVAEVLGDREVLGQSYAELKAGVEKANKRVADASPAERDEAMKARMRWEPNRRMALKLVGSRLLNRRFRDAGTATVVGVALAAIGVALFAWGSNPPEDETDAPVALGEAPVRERVTLTATGVSALAESRGCRRSRLTVLTIGGTEGSREVVTVPAGTCRSVRFVLTPSLGTAVAAG